MFHGRRGAPAAGTERSATSRRGNEGQAPTVRVAAESAAVMAVIDQTKLRAVLDRVHREVDQGILPAVQIAVAYEDELVAFEAVGDATTDTRFVVFSATKPFVAAAVASLIADGAIDTAAPVSSYVPEFTTNGKDAVTVEQVMLHTAGFPAAPLGPPQWYTRDGRLAAFARWRLNWEPGTRYEYHPTSAHWVLAEILERVTSSDYRDVVQARVTDPAGLPRVLGVDETAPVAPLAVRGEPPTPDELEAVPGVRELPVTEVTDAALMLFNDPANRALGVPGGGGVMRACDLALFYQALLHGSGDILPPGMLADFTGHVRQRFRDPLLGQPANRTLGVIVAGDDGLAFLRGLGRTTSPRAFGHGGAAGQIGWADPATGLSLGYLTNGIDAHVLRLYRRSTAISSLAASCAA